MPTWIGTALKVLKVAWPYLVAAAIAAAAAWYIQDIRIGHLENTIVSRDNDIKKWDIAYKACKEANATDAATITELQGDVKDANKRCGTQLSIKEQTTKRLWQIDMMRPAFNTKGAIDEKNIPGTGYDPLLSALNSMFIAANGKASGDAGKADIHQAAGPSTSGTAAGLPGQLQDKGPSRVNRWYCADEIAAKNLLKNFELRNGRMRELEAII